MTPYQLGMWIFNNWPNIVSYEWFLATQNLNKEQHDEAVRGYYDAERLAG